MSEVVPSRRRQALLSAANVGSSETIAKILSRVRAEIIYANTSRLASQTTLGKPLVDIAALLLDRELSAADGLDSSFVIHGSTEIRFNQATLQALVDGVATIFSASEFSQEDVESYKRRAIALFVLHELYHVQQGFTERRFAGVLKRAFGADELSKIDLVADIQAAHCQSFMAACLADVFTFESFLSDFRANIMLSYQILSLVFKVENDHKKKRALGLLTNFALVDRVLLAGQSVSFSAVSVAIRPAFTSVDLESNYLVILSCSNDGWKILMGGCVETNKMTVRDAWASVGTEKPNDIIGLLKMALNAFLPIPDKA